MKTVELKNSHVIKILNEISEYFTQKEIYKMFRSPPDYEYLKWDKFTSESYLKMIMSQGKNHHGYPEITAGHVVSYQKGWKIFECDIPTGKIITKKYGELNCNLTNYLALKNNALWTIYPPGGYISWHNNANAAAYNFIFTWSETGEGWFKYLDGKTNEIVTIEDKPGWQCKAGYFGSYDDPLEKLCYHSAYTDCLRMTVAYTLNTSDMARKWQDEIIEELETEIL